MSAGYSGTPLPQKLKIKQDTRLLLVRCPTELEDQISAGATKATDQLEVIVTFCMTLAELETAVTDLTKHMKPNGALWIAWPKKASKVPTEITEDRIRDVALPTGLVDIKVCAIDATWSGLKLVWRKELRRNPP